MILYPMFISINSFAVNSLEISVCKILCANRNSFTLFYKLYAFSFFLLPKCFG